MGTVDESFLRAALDDGWLTALVPRALGGEGARTADLAVAMEELCAACGGLGLLVGANSLGLAGPIFALDAGIWRRVVEPAARERGTLSTATRPTLFAWAITEPSSGSDSQDGVGMSHLVGCTHARRVPGGYRIEGRKVFISNGSIARFVIVHAALDRARPRESWTAFLVDTRAPGFVAVRDEEKLGQRASPATEIVFEDVFVPEDDRVGPEGFGFVLGELILAGSRAPVGAIATGIARGALEATIAAFSNGTRPDDWTRDAIAEMGAKIVTARLCYLDAALAFDALMPPSWLDDVVARVLRLSSGVLPPAMVKRGCESMFRRMVSRLDLRSQLAHASIAKSSCADLAMSVCDRAAEIVPRGARERPFVEKALRDVKLTQIYEGTNQINRIAIADALLGPRL